MSEVGYPRSAEEVVAIVAEIFVSQGKSDLASLLESAVATIEQIDYDNWDGGTYTWALRLEVPVGLFAKSEDRLKDIESEILKKVGFLNRMHPSDHLDEITIIPLSLATAALGKKATPSNIDVGRIWGVDGFKLFLSHASKHRVAVEQLSKELSIFGISAFVAHSDIEPSLEWCGEIEIALRSMDALTALITPEFHSSFWTDQEVGWAFGRGVLALPVMLGATPYGFLGKFQGVAGGDLESPSDLTAKIVRALLANRQTQAEMRRALIAAFENVNTYKRAQSVSKMLSQLSDFTEDEKTIIWRASERNTQIKEAYGILSAIERLIGKCPTKPSTMEEDIPF